MTDRTPRQLISELDAFEEALCTPWSQITEQQAELIRTSALLTVAGKTLDRAATFDALRNWLA